MEKACSFRKLLSTWAAAVVGTDFPQPPEYDGRDIDLVNLVEHTGDVVDGSCFVARVRTGTDGHPYIGQAISGGAKLIIGQRDPAELDVIFPADVVYLPVADSAETVAWLAAAWHDFPSRELTVIGITGTDGKTSTSTILFDVLQAAGCKVGLISTIKAVIGNHEEPTGLHVSTPEAPAVQAYLRRMVEAGNTHCILESTSHGLEQHRVSAVDYNVAAVTNITHEHLDYHGSYEGYFGAKARLFAMVAQGAANWAAEGAVYAAIINRDDESYDGLLEIAGPRTIVYGIDLPAQVQATDLDFAVGRTEFKLTIAGQPEADGLEIVSPLPGKFNIYNLLCAAAIADSLGFSPTLFRKTVANIDLISGRMERIDAGQDFLTVVDFAHTPNALEKAIGAARPLVADQGGRVITVFGSAGKRDIEKRRMMAEVSAQLAEVTVLTAEDPRTEPLDDILEMMAGGCRRFGGIEGDTFWRIRDRGEAIYFALTLARPEDIVLVCGKGHEQSMNFDGTEYPWDDRQATQAALEAFLAGRPMVDLGLPTFGGRGS